MRNVRAELHQQNGCGVQPVSAGVSVLSASVIIFALLFSFSALPFFSFRTLDYSVFSSPLLFPFLSVMIAIHIFAFFVNAVPFLIDFQMI